MKQKPNEADPVLCYVKDGWAYFTDLALEEQSGSDWHKRPYEHNACRPYDDEHVRTIVAFDGSFETPEDYNGCVSVEDINAGVMAWISTSRWADSDVKRIVIRAGTPVSEFKRLIRLAGGKVYTEEVK